MRPAHLACLSLLMLASSCGGTPTPPPGTPTTTGGTDPTQALIPAGSAGSTKADRMTSPAWSSCHSSYQIAGADMATEVGKLAQGCTGVTKMHAASDVFKGAQSASNPPQTFKFKAKAKHCYRAYAAAANTIKDLDLLIKDSTGAVAGEDSTDDPTPVVLEDGAVCFKDDDEATVVVSVGDGNGAYAAQVWGDD